VPHPVALRPRQQAVDDLADDQRREGAVLLRSFDQPREPQRRIEQLGVQMADGDGTHAAAALAAWSGETLVEPLSPGRTLLEVA
jgi:hypothetical protein